MLKKKLALGLVVMSCVSVLTFVNPSEVFAKTTDEMKVEVREDKKDLVRAQYALEIGIVRAASGLNVRSGAGANYEKIGFVYYGEEVTIRKRDGGWTYISYLTSSGGVKYGWVASQYIEGTGRYDQ
ncbi:SH3 domain-containing protein [Clostridium sp. MSJ-4]|uniref:SH3 domain-containing protein n=1 Tax=Clostridium simiarum TaxID=2841506 RepID=A0ABS6F0P8_9CLOT|nr:SH3 domain-containing protein [Clostridium simiarum]MBU5592050.1 SH3 domain-containing protein [Clostridium simiarum]